MPPRKNKAWTEPEYRRAVKMLGAGVSQQEVAQRMGRTDNSIHGISAKARSRGDLRARYGLLGDEEKSARWNLMADILEAFILDKGVTIDDVMEPKGRDCSLRREAMFLMVSAKNADGAPALPYQTIGAFFDLDHSTVIGGVRHHAKMHGLTVERRQFGRRKTRQGVNGSHAHPSTDPQIMVESLADGRGALTPRPPLHQRPSGEVRQCREAI